MVPHLDECVLSFAKRYGMIAESDEDLYVSKIPSPSDCIITR